MSLRRCFVALVALASASACAAEDGAAADDVTEDDLTFRASAVDRSLPDVDAIGYEVDLRVDDVKGHEAFRADVSGTYVATRDLTELSLDLDGNAIDSVKVGARAARYRRDGNKLVITLPAPVASGKTFKTRIAYHGDVRQADGADPNDFEAFGGLMVRQRNADGRRIYTSLNWPSKARRWLPLRDHPSDGAMLAISATFPKAFTVVANGKRVSQTDNADGSRTWRYEALTPMPVYDFHVTAYDGWKEDASSSKSGVPIASYTYSSAASKAHDVFGDLPAALDFYEEHFGKYRWGTATFLEEPIFGGGMEHASVVSMDETLFPSPSEAREVACHELAHHWSGNLARIRTWNDFWLSEGFTEYLKARFMAAHDGPEAKKQVLHGYLRDALAADRSSPHPVRPPDPEVNVLTIFDAISYQKGALVLRQLERIVGEEQMTTFLKGWFDKHAFGAVTTADLEKELSAASGRDLSKVFAGFVYGTGHPVVRVRYAAAGTAGDVDVTVEQIQTGEPFVFPLDLDFIGDGGKAERASVEVTGKTTTARVHLAATPTSVVVDPDEYLLGTVACDATTRCKTGFSCSSQVCVPR